MSREELIKAIYDNDDAWSCPDYHCDKPEEEGNTGECCLKCAEKQLKAYEDKIRANVIDGYRKEMHDMIEGNEEFTDWQKYEILECNDLVAEQLKEQDNEQYLCPGGYDKRTMSCDECEIPFCDYR